MIARPAPPPGAPVVLLDVDGVVCDFATAFVQEVSRVVGRVLDPTRVDQYDVTRWAGATPEQERAAYEAARAPGWCRALRPYDGAREFVDALHEVAEVVAVTAPMRGPHWHHERVEWLHDEVGIHPDHVIFAKRKELVHGDVLVEDRPANALAWARARQGHALLVHRSYNALDEPDWWRVRRVFSLSEVLAAVRSLRE